MSILYKVTGKTCQLHEIPANGTLESFILNILYKLLNKIIYYIS